VSPPPIPNAADCAELIPGKIHIWFACVDRSFLEIREFAAVLSPEETARAQRFRSDRDRERYIVQHGVLRSLLAGYLGCGARQVDIGSSAHGKPCLTGKDTEGSLQFSLSHSGAYAAFAFGRYNSIGVDIEEVREIPEMEGIVAEHFTPREKAVMLSCPIDTRLKTFYRFWTRKEAVLKAQGEGLLRSLDCVDVAKNADANEPWKVQVAGEPILEEYWVSDAECPAGFATAVAADGPFAAISVWLIGEEIIEKFLSGSGM
jgi:4'-phosphopantetheinyl transferase